MSEPKLKDRMQIRLWINDRHPIVLSENSWTQSNNHALHGNIQDELERYRKEETEPETTAQKTNEVNEFGMPNY